MTRRVAVILNRSAGAGRDDRVGESLARALRKAGAEPTVHEVPGGRLRPTVRSLLESRAADAIVAAGGDGTVSSVAAELVGRDVPLGVLATGTLNHFARDARVPLELGAAAAAIASAEATPVDVGSVNGVPFLNNAMLGLYADGVRVRDRWRRWIGKWPASGVAWCVMLKRYPSLNLSLELEGARLERRSPLVVVSNNPYGAAAIPGRQRDRLDQGALGVYVVPADGRFRLVWRALKSLVAPVDGIPDLERMVASELVVHLTRRRPKVALDGEVTRLEMPLRFRTLPGALRVIGVGAAATSPS